MSFPNSQPEFELLFAKSKSDATDRQFGITMRYLIGIVLQFAVFSCANAQQALPINGPVNVPSSGSTSDGSTKDSATELLDGLRQLKLQVSGGPQNSALPQDDAKPVLRTEGRPTKNQEPVKVDALQQRIELLKSIMAKKQLAAQAAQAAPPTTPNPVNVKDGHAAGAVSNSQSPVILEKHDEFPMPALESHQPETADGNQSIAPFSSEPEFVGQSVVPTAVDPLELANSLFATGNFELALKTYQAAIKRANEPHDVLWTDYFIASCHRIRGDVSQAEVGYRNLAATKRPTYPVATAQWWLAHLEKRKGFQTKLAEIDSQLKAISAEVSKYGK